MQDSTSPEITRILEDLSTGLSPFGRERAARQLGELSTTNAEIVQALAIAQEFDKDIKVRAEARQALQSEATHAFLKDNPGFLRKVIASAEQAHAQAERMEQTQITDEFLRRRSRERWKNLFLIGGFIAFWILFIATLPTMTDEILCVFQISPILLVGVYLWLHWKNWRCPACDSWLGGWTVQINPIWFPESIRCPHCGKKLL